MGGKGKEFMEMMGSQGGKMPEMVKEMMAEKEGLCLSQDEVFTDFLIATYCPSIVTHCIITSEKLTIQRSPLTMHYAAIH